MNKLLLVALIGAVTSALFVGTDVFHLGGSSTRRGLLDVLSTIGKPAGVGSDFANYDQRQNSDAADREQSMVNAYYNLATDFYEYGWGKSFHFAHTLKEETHEESILRHEHRLIDILGLKPGMTAVDLGCGVGGPARAIASKSGANVVGVTLNEYQVQKAAEHTQNENLTHLVNVVQGDFTKMDFKSNTMDAAYAIEATCHAPRLEDVYGEVFRILKPGGKFATYEWLTTSFYDASNEEHREIVKEIEYGDGLPPLRTLEQALSAAKTAGFKLVSENDLSMDEEGTRPWYSMLDLNGLSMTATHWFCRISEALGMAPEGTTATHGMLLRAADGLVRGGKTKIFTPMHLLVFEKPAKTEPAKTEKPAKTAPAKTEKPAKTAPAKTAPEVTA